MFNDRSTYGAGLARNIELCGQGGSGIKVEGNDGTDKNAPNYRSLAARIKDRLLRGVGRDRRERRPGVQGRGRRGAGRQAVRARTAWPRRRSRTRRRAASPPTSPRARRSRWPRSDSKEFTGAKPRPRSSSRTSETKYERRSARPVRDLRLRDDGARARHARARLATSANDRQGRDRARSSTRRARRASSARTTSTRTVTPRSPTTVCYDHQRRAATFDQERSGRPGQLTEGARVASVEPGPGRRSLAPRLRSPPRVKANGSRLDRNARTPPPGGGEAVVGEFDLALRADRLPAGPAGLLRDQDLRRRRATLAARQQPQVRASPTARSGR